MPLWIQRRDDGGGGDLGCQRDGQKVREQLGRLLERSQNGSFHERLQLFSEEQDAKDGGDRELEAGVVDKQGVPGEDGGQHGRHEMQGRELGSEDRGGENEGRDHASPYRRRWGASDEDV